MKASYAVSKWAWIITAVFFVTALLGFIIQANDGRRSDPGVIAAFAMVFGLLAQIVLGIIHLGIAVYAYTQYKKLYSNERTLLNVYAVLVAVFFAAWSVLAQSNFLFRGEDTLTFIIVIPMLIGVYFVFVAYKIKASGVLNTKAPALPDVLD